MAAPLPVVPSGDNPIRAARGRGWHPAIPPGDWAFTGRVNDRRARRGQCPSALSTAGGRDAPPSAPAPGSSGRQLRRGRRTPSRPEPTPTPRPVRSTGVSKKTHRALLLQWDRRGAEPRGARPAGAAGGAPSASPAPGRSVPLAAAAGETIGNVAVIEYKGLKTNQVLPVTAPASRARPARC